MRRRFYELAATSPVATEVLRRIALLYAIEDEVRGADPEIRRTNRIKRSRVIIDDLRLYLDARNRQVSAKSKLGEAIRYALTRWDGLALFIDDGRVDLDNNTVERSIRPLATTDSYCTSSSNVRKQGLLVFSFDATRASVSRELGDFVLFQIRGSDLVWRIRDNLLGRGLNIRALLEACGDDLSGLRDRALLSTAYDTGLPASELVAVCVEHIVEALDPEARLLEIARSKADQDGEGATAFLSPRSVRAIAAWRAASGIGSGPLFRRVLVQRYKARKAVPGRRIESISSREKWDLRKTLPKRAMSAPMEYDVGGGLCIRARSARSGGQ